MKNLRGSIHLAAAAALAFCGCIFSQENLQKAPDQKASFEKMIALADQFQKSGPALYTYEFKGKTTLGDGTVHYSSGVIKVAYDKASGRCRHEEIDLKNDPDDVTIYDLIIWDGSRQMIYSASISDAKVRDYVDFGIPKVPGGGSALISPDAPSLGLFKRDFGYKLLGQDDVVKLLADIGRPPHTTIQPCKSEATLDVLRVSIPQPAPMSTVLIDIDPASGMLLGFVQDSGAQDGKRCRKVGAIFHSGKFPFPDEIVVHMDPGVGEPKGATYETRFTAIKPQCRKLTMEEFERLLLEPLPPGTRVRDKVLQKIYTIPAGNPQPQ